MSMFLVVGVTIVGSSRHRCLYIALPTYHDVCTRRYTAGRLQNHEWERMETRIHTLGFSLSQTDSKSENAVKYNNKYAKLLTITNKCN